MKQTRGAIGNLINRYRAVLKKCHLLNTFGSLAFAGMLVLGGANASLAEELTITDVVDSNGRYSGSNQETLTFDAPLSETSHFEGVASGFGTIQINKGTTVSVANLCTGIAGDATGGGIWGDTNEAITVNVTGEGTLVAEHVSVAANQQIVVFGNLKLVNVSDGEISELVLDPNGSLIVKKDATLDVIGATKVETTKTNFLIEEGATLKIGGGSTFTVNGNIGDNEENKTGHVIADGSTFHAVGNRTETGNIHVNSLSVQNNGTVKANDSINVDSIAEADGCIMATNDISAGHDITKADNAQLTLNAGNTITANNIDATHVAAQTLKAQKATVDEGTLSLTGANGTASEVGNLSLTNGTKADIQGTLNLTDETSILAVGSTSDTEGGTTLSAQNVNLKGGMILVDPAWDKASSNVAVADLGNSTGGAEDIVSLGGKVGVGQNSYMAIGTTDITWLRGVVGKLSKDGTQAALGLFRPITIESGNGLVVNGTLTGVTEDRKSVV